MAGAPGGNAFHFGFCRYAGHSLGGVGLTAWEAAKESYREHGEPLPVAPARKEYSGQFNVRIDKALHRRLAVEAGRAGISMNALVARKLAGETVPQ